MTQTLTTRQARGYVAAVTAALTVLMVFALANPHHGAAGILADVVIYCTVGLCLSASIATLITLGIVSR
jgi:hypothetical protein